MPMKKKASRVLAAIDAQQWLISDEWMETFRAIAERENDLDAFLLNKELSAEMNDVSALLTTHDGHIEGTSAVKRGNTAVIPIIGPIFPRANIMTNISGGTSVEMIARDTQIAKSKGLDVLLYVSSPGGAVEGISEYAQMIAGLDAVAYVSGYCTSAAYWIASQCSSIIVGDTAVVGNIGVKSGRPTGDDDSVVSDNAPNKIMTEKSVKGIVNDIESVFLSAVASGRNTTVEDVAQNFGKGGVFVGQKAVDARLADGVSTLEALLNLSANQARETYRKPEMAMTQEEKDQHAQELAALQAKLDAETARADKAEADAQTSEDAPTAERQRINAILASAPDKPKAAMSIAMNTSLSVEEATAALAGMQAETAEQTADPLQAAMNGTNPSISDDGTSDEPSEEAQVASSWDSIIKGVAA